MYSDLDYFMGRAIHTVKSSAFLFNMLAIFPVSVDESTSVALFSEQEKNDKI